MRLLGEEIVTDTNINSSKVIQGKEILSRLQYIMTEVGTGKYIM